MFKHITCLLTFILIGGVAFTQTNEERKKRADKNFESEHYIEATADYLHLLSLEPMSYELNFKYGACLLYNSNQKSKSIRYLNYAVLDEAVDPRAHYFRGKALHLNFQFKEAITDYETYLNKTGGKSDKRYNAAREIEMCKNGKRLLTTFTDIIVADKKEIDQEKFFRIYSDSKTIGGEILVTAKFQSKMDKKMGHVPIVHYPPNAKAIYYASYGEDGVTGLDIYIRRRLPDNSWGDPQKLPGAVNTSEDEDFPYMHPSGNFLYFSSTGHNSMGGYDVFMSRFDPNTNSFKTPENVDFAISSPDDDLFYVVDSLFQNAYFASSRQSSDGNLHVYKVKVARVPIQEVIVIGDFLSEINPENKEMTISLTSHSNGEAVGEIKTNKVGKYSFVFPQGGKYDYLVDVAGSSEQYRFTIELPFLSEFRPLKQKVVHELKDGAEIVRIVNLFDEKVEGAEALIAEVIRKKSELDVNIDKFDLEELELEARKKEILADIGYTGMSLNEVTDQLIELKETNANNTEVSDRIEANIDTEILAKTERIKTLDNVEKELLKQAEKASDPLVKHKLLNEAKHKAEEKEMLIASVEGLKELKSSAKDNIGLDPSSVENLEEAVTAYSSAISEGDDVKAVKVLNENKDVLIAAKQGSPEGLVNEFIQESKAIGEKIDALKEQEQDYDKEIERLKTEIFTLESKLQEAKKKEAEDLKSLIAEKEQELGMVEDARMDTHAKIQELNRELSSKETQIASLQNAIDTDEIPAVDPKQVEASITEVESIASSSQQIDYDEQIAQLENDNPELFGTEPISTDSDPLTDLKEEFESKSEQIKSDPSTTELEQTYSLIENNEDAIKEANSQLTIIEEQLSSDPDNSDLQADKEAIESYLADLTAENETYKEHAKKLKNVTPDAALSKEDIVKDISPTYEDDIAAIQSNSALSEKEKLEQQQALQSRFLSKVEDELASLESMLTSDPENSEAEVKREILKEVLSDIESDIATTDAALSSIASTAETARVQPVKPNDVLKGYEEDVALIEEDNSLSPLEKEEKLKSQDEKLIEAAEKEKAKVDKKLKKNPEDEDLIQQSEQLTQLIEMTQASIDERNQTIAALEGTTSEPTKDEVNREEVISSIDPEYEAGKKEFEKEAKKTRKGKVSLLELETSFYDKLKTREEELKEAIQKDPENEYTPKELAEVQSMLAEQVETIEDIQSELAEEMTPEEKSSLIAQVLPGYSEDTAEGDDKDAVIDQEVELQMAINDRLNQLAEEKKRKFSVSIGYEEKQLKQLLSDSQQRENDARQGDIAVTNEDDDKEEFISSIRKDNTEVEAVIAEGSSVEELKAQDDLLAQYEENLDELIEEKEKEVKKSPSTRNEAELDWLKEEKETVSAKRRAVKIQIGELETSVASTEDDPELNRLSNEQQSLEEKLLDENLSSSERKSVEKALEENLSEQTSRENEILEENIENKTTETEVLAAALESIDETTTSGQKASQIKEAVASEQAVINSLEEQVASAKSEEEKNFLLREANDRREQLNNDTKEAIEEIKLAEIEEENDVSMQTKEDLMRKKRTFTIGIGELTTEILKKEEEISNAKKKEIPVLEEEKSSLEAQREVLIDRLERVDEQLAAFEDSEPVIAEAATDKPITFNEERKVASSEEYKEYEELASAALEVEEQISNLEEALKLEKRKVAELVAEGGDNGEEIAMHVAKIKEIESDIDRLNIDLVQKKWVADQALPDNEDEAMKMQNLVARGVKPIKTALVAASILNMPTTGFAVDANAESVYSAENPIPVGVEAPSGLVYRVQVGAFAKPIPQDLFKEFNPVSGEKIGGTNITRYMAGFFNSSDDVVEARTQIRALGYNDAFVVAYCDGERIGFGDARRREAEGSCVPKGTSEIMIEVATKTAERLGIPTSNEVQRVPEHTYAQAPGAAGTEPIEQMQGLFFTVQIGVFNRPVGDEALHGMTEVITLRLPNGQIRYSSGRFDSVEEALPRRELALNNGVRGAFVTAYYEGQRISIGEAKRILAENGRSVLQSEMEKTIVEETEPEIDTVNVVRTDSVAPTYTESVEEEFDMRRVQVVTKKTFSEYPRDILNRYNAEGSFYYDEADGRVKSVIYKNEDYLPRLYNFRNDIDTVYIPFGLMDDEMTKIVEIAFSDSIIPGDFMDMLLRFNYRRSFETTEAGAVLRVYGVQESKIEGILNEIREFGVEPVVKEETELELELEENN